MMHSKSHLTAKRIRALTALTGPDDLELQVVEEGPLVLYVYDIVLKLTGAK